MESEEGRSERKKREARERIVAAAAELFIQKGSAAVSMDEVAEASDVARRTLFNYFASKDELLYAVAAPVLTEAIALAEAELGAASRKEGDGIDAIAQLCLALWAKCGRRLGIIYSVELGDSPELAALHARFLGLLRRLIGRLVAGNQELVGKLVYRGFVPLLLALEGEEEAEARFARGLRGLVEGAAGRLS